MPMRFVEDLPRNNGVLIIRRLDFGLRYIRRSKRHVGGIG